MMRWHKSARLALAVACALTFALVPASAERLPLRAYTSADGLPRDQVSAILADSRGYVWFGTPEGLSRFDGQQFVSYGLDEGLPDASVNEIRETGDGNLWIATSGGLCRFVPEGPSRFACSRVGDDPPGRTVTTLHEDRAGQLWVGTGRGLFRLVTRDESPSFVETTVVPVPADNPWVAAVWAILDDGRGSLWVGGRWLHRVREGRVESFAAAESMPDTVSDLAVDPGGRVWAATHFGLCLVAAEPTPGQAICERTYTTSDGLPANRLTTLQFARDGTLWLGGGALIRAEPRENGAGWVFRSFAREAGLTDPHVQVLAEDRAGDLWIGTESGGALRLAARGFTAFDETDGLPGVRVGSVFEDRSGTLDVYVTGPGYGRFDGRRFRSVRPRVPPSIREWGWGWGQVDFQDRAGDWWLGSKHGVLRYTGGLTLEGLATTLPAHVYTSRNGLGGDDVFRLYEDTRGDVWISTWGPGYLTRWERRTGTLRVIGREQGLNQVPMAFENDGAGNLWMGLWGGGLGILRPSGIILLGQADGVPRGHVLDLHLDRHGRMWIASSRGGLVRADEPHGDRPRFAAKYSTADGLSSNHVRCIIEGVDDVLYLGTGRGVDRLDLADGLIRHYTTADGLPNSEVTTGLRARDGAIWFGTLQGLARLEPGDVPAQAPIDPVITAVRVAGVARGLAELGQSEVAGLTLGPSSGSLQIDFVSVGGRPAGPPRYQFRFSGRGAEFGAATSEHSVLFPRLAPGRYRFEVQAVNAEGVPSERTASVAFRVLPPIWRRGWFLAFAGAALALAVSRLHRARVQRLLQLERVRTRIATDLHDDIGSSLSRIALLSDLVRHQVETAHPASGQRLAQIASSARDLVGAMADIVWALDPRHDDLEHVVRRIREFAADVLGGAGVSWGLSAPEDSASVRMGAEPRRHTYLILKEAITNVARHARAREVDLRLHVADGRLNVEIRDDGRGFTPDETDRGSRPSGGNGLRNMRARAAECGGTLSVESTPERGTRIRIVVPLRGESKNA